MGIGKILSRFGYHKGVPISFMSWKGDCNSPGFTIKLGEWSGVRNAYLRCAPVQAVVNRLASSMANGKWWIVDKDNNDVSQRYPAISKLIKKPNPLQTKTEFIKQVDTYRNLYQVTYVYAVIPEGFDRIEDATALWPVNPERIDPVYRKDKNVYFSKGTEDIIESYTIKIGSDQIKNINPTHILKIKDSFLDIFDSDVEKCSTRLKGLEHEIKNTILAQEAVYALNKDRGAFGILSNRTKDASGSIPITPEEKKEIRDAYRADYGMTLSQAKILLTNSDLFWQQMSFNTKDLMLFEGLKQNQEGICDAFNYPFELLANQNGVKYENRNEAIKYLYQDNIIPASNIYAEKFTEFFGLEDAVIDIDFSHIEYLKEAEKEKAEALLKMSSAIERLYKITRLITAEEARIMLDLDEKPKGGTFYEERGENDKTPG